MGEALLQGRLDGALIARDWAVAPAIWGRPGSASRACSGGYVSELDSVGRTLAKLKVPQRSRTAQPFKCPRSLLPRCKNVFGDFRCGVDLNTLACSAPWALARPARRSLGRREHRYGLRQDPHHERRHVTRVRTIREGRRSNLYLTYPLDFDPAPAWNSRPSPAARGCSPERTAAKPIIRPTIKEPLRRLSVRPGGGNRILVADEIAERVAVVTAGRHGRDALSSSRGRPADRRSGRDRLRHLLLEAHVGAGLIEPFEIGSTIRTIGTCTGTKSASLRRRALCAGRRRCERTDLRARSGFRVLPGNVLIWRFGRTFSHGAIVSAVAEHHPRQLSRRGAARGILMGGRWRKCRCASYSYWGS
jgi:hypothetical protein